MQASPRLTRRRPAAFAVLAVFVAFNVACGSDDSVDEPPPPTVDDGTVVPPDPNDVDGGVPVDNLNPDIADSGAQETDDVDGDGAPEP